AERIFATSNGSDERNARSDAQEFLREILEGGPKLSKDIQGEAKEAGISERTLWRAKSSLGIKAHREGAPGTENQKWSWQLPETQSGQMDTASADEATVEENTWQTQPKDQSQAFCFQHFSDPANESVSWQAQDTESDDWGEEI